MLTCLRSPAPLVFLGTAFSTLRRPERRTSGGDLSSALPRRPTTPSIIILNTRLFSTKFCGLGLGRQLPLPLLVLLFCMLVVVYTFAM